MELYASLGIQDYFLCDIEGLYLPSPLMGFTLVDGVYVPISANVDGGLHSPALNLDFHIGDVDVGCIPLSRNLDFPADVMGLGIYDPVGDAWLQTPAESALAQAELASARAENAETRAETAETRAENAEARRRNRRNTRRAGGHSATGGGSGERTTPSGTHTLTSKEQLTDEYQSRTVNATIA